MTSNSWEFTRGGGLKFWREDEQGTIIEEIVLNPTTNGKGEIEFTADDGTTKRGTVEPGSASGQGLGK